MNSIVKKIFDTGIQNTKGTKENKKIKLLNIFCFTWSVMIPVITIFDIIFGRELEGSLIMHGVSYILIAFIFYFQSKQFYTLARVLFLSSIIGVTFVFANYTTPLNLIENFYFVYPLIALILVDKKWINIVILVVCFLLYFVPNLYYEHYPKNTILPVLVFSVFVAAFVILNYAETLNKKHEKELLLNKEQLEQAFLELEERKKSELASLQLKALKAQMNPHFLFNAINSIQNLILTNNKEEAYKYLTKFSLLMRESLKTSEKSFINFDVELSMLKKYLELEKLRFGEDFIYEIKGEKEIQRIKIPSSVIQSFIENAIRYGLLHKTDGKKIITIEFYQSKIFTCVITDNGIGIEASKKVSVLNTKSNINESSIIAIQNRLQLLNEFYKMDIGVSYEEVEEGTKVVIKLPYTI